MTRQVLRVTLKGTSPLLMHSGVLLDPLHPITVELESYHTKPRKSAADYMNIGDLEFLGGLWRTGDLPCVPARTLEAAVREAAERCGADKRIRMAISVDRDAVLEYVGPQSIDALSADPSFRLRAAVTIDGRRRMRTRPIFRQWSLRTAIVYDDTLIDRAELINVLIVAGDNVGVGDGRPRYGTFSVAPTDEAGV